MRREKVLVIDAPNRDNAKKFKLTEASPIRAEEWGARLLLLLIKAGAEVPDNMSGVGGLSLVANAMAGTVEQALPSDLAMLGNLNWFDVKPILDEMFNTCVRIMPDPAHPEVARALIEDDIEEVMTIVNLRKEVIMLHIGFFTSGGPSTSQTSGTAPTASPT